ncbi:hypothetical protein FPV67DRAFT_507323 [Lyophyllum atratum]|nr:hypothetical protein FPV67DRAFT_507323 [Lyophyllum atratum]
MATLDLPVDIWDEILHHMREDEATLRATSLTCRGLVEISQRHLFSTITLNPPLGNLHNNYSDRFRRLLRHAPHIASYVHTLNIIDGHQPPRRHHVHCQWVLASATLPSVLRFLKNLKSVSIQRKGRDIPTDRLSWNLMSAALRDGLIGACRSIESLSLKGVERFLGPLIDVSPQIKELSIGDNVCFPNSTMSSGRVDLHALEVIAEASALDWCCNSRSGLRLSSLRKLVITKPWAFNHESLVPHDALLRLFHKCGSTVKELTCSINHLDDSAGGNMLGVLHTLRFLTIYVDFSRTEDHPPNSLLRVLDVISNASTIQEITVIIHYHIPIKKVSQEGWDALDALLAGPIFPYLRMFKLIISMNDIYQTYRPKAIPFFRRWLHRLHARRALRVVVEKGTGEVPRSGCWECG